MEDHSWLLKAQGSHENLLVLQAQSQPSFGGQRHHSPDQTKQSGMRAVSYEDGEGSSDASTKEVYPSPVAARQRFRTFTSETELCPSERKIIIGVLSFKKLQKRSSHMKTRLSYEPFRAPIFHHDFFGFAETFRKVCSAAGLLTQHNI
jgi:hypothetical protein